MILLGDCVELMAGMAEASVDAVVTDPPYGLEFMGKEWDRLLGRGGVGTTDQGAKSGWSRYTLDRPLSYQGGLAAQDWHYRWATEALRVLKPGGHLLAFGGTRTYHRLACALEDAGFEIRDCLVWMYGSGFPKSLDVSKAIDKAAGVEREVVGTARGAGSRGNTFPLSPEYDASLPATPEAQRWQGWGTALKPAHEPIVVARKPLAGTVAANVLEHGTGAINVDATRLDVEPYTAAERRAYSNGDTGLGRTDAQTTRTLGTPRQGESGGPHVRHERLRPNGCGCALPWTGLPDSPGGCPTCRRSDGEPSHRGQAVGLAAARPLSDVPEPLAPHEGGSGNPLSQSTAPNDYTSLGRWPSNVLLDESVAADLGEVARYFYVAKASRAERNAGLEGFEERARQEYGSIRSERGPGYEAESRGRNHHPTVKPIALMRWLVRLVTPPGGLVLDPFAGSGTTGIACALEGFEFTGCEQDADYAKIAEARIAFWQEHGEDGLRIVAERERAEAEREAIAASGQLDLLGGVA